MLYVLGYQLHYHGKSLLVGVLGHEDLVAAVGADLLFATDVAFACTRLRLVSRFHALNDRSILLKVLLIEHLHQLRQVVLQGFAALLALSGQLRAVDHVRCCDLPPLRHERLENGQQLAKDQQSPIL